MFGKPRSAIDMCDGYQANNSSGHSHSNAEDESVAPSHDPALSGTLPFSQSPIGHVDANREEEVGKLNAVAPDSTSSILAAEARFGPRGVVGESSVRQETATPDSLPAVPLTQAPIWRRAVGGENSVQQGSAAVFNIMPDSTSVSEADVENAQRETESFRTSQDSLNQQIEALSKKLLEVTSAKGACGQKTFHTNIAPSTINATNNAIRFDSSAKMIRLRARASKKRWNHAIRMIVFSFLALSWFHLQLLATSSLPTKFAERIDEYPSFRGATEISLLNKKMKHLNEQLQRVEQEKVHEGGLTVLCVVARDEESYIDEFIDYHLGLGFGKIVIYDNSEKNELEQWGENRGAAVEVVHSPGVKKQTRSYWDCAKNALEGKYGKKQWAAFWDVDEFLVLKKHDNVDELLGEYLAKGALGINWHLFGPNGKSLYQPLPVTKRFTCRQNRINSHTKSFVKLEDMDYEQYPHVHYPYIIRGTQHDTNGKSFVGPNNEDGPSDVVVLHHFRTKSVKEFLQKSIRGRADVVDDTKNPYSAYNQRLHNAVDMFDRALTNDVEQRVAETCHGMTHDDSAWIAMKKISPKYALYDALTFTENSLLPPGLESSILELEF